MKKTILVILTLGFMACNQRKDRIVDLQNQIDSLESKLINAYKPGFGEFMSSIQIHHNKLWFAGQNENWRLADFEVHEIKETMDAIQKYETDRKESKMIGVLNTSLDSVDMAIQQKNALLFTSSFNLLTNTCNNCHRVTNFEFNVVKIPEIPILSNQEFKLIKK